jgi:site-specific recombinase XerD
VDVSYQERFSRLRIEGPLTPFLQPYRAHLAEQGFAQISVWRKTYLIGEFSQWLKRRKVSIEHLTDDHCRAFAHDRARSHQTTSGHLSALTSLLSWLQSAGAIACPAPAVSEPSQAERLLQEYSRYLREERGLEPCTIKRYTLVVRRLLQRTPQGSRAPLSALKAQDVCDFIRQYAPRGQSFSMGKDATTALRSFLRFARLQDYIHSDLAAAVPAVPGWSMASIPRAMPLKVVRAVLAHSKRRRTPCGLRDRAILLLLARLGLRAREVVRLKLEDIDWRTSSLRIRGKTPQEDPLPMPADVGEAVAHYLRYGRSKTSLRAVFLCARAPLRGLGGSSTIARILHRALARAGIRLAHEGTHQFRHGLATQMLHKGLSLTEIGQLLRHHSADATRRYAKVDLRALREVALPWPGGVP